MIYLLFLRAIIWVLIINYFLLNKGLSVKGAETPCDSPQFLYNLVLIKLYLATFAPFPFCKHFIFVYPLSSHVNRLMLC